MDSRTIDIAKSASLDLMTLNNKVVNMRQVVKRTKVHVISKLCRQIDALKKKKGTEQQRAKNLRRANRILEEIESIKKLKKDKVTKYALANTASFSDILKSNLSAAPRALSRLSDHPLMKKVVADFREQHSDWRDLAAYLLVKQTGRRFKTKIQKQKKRAWCIENINASETMTKAYIQERFGQEGLTKAEQRFERKRRRPKSGKSTSRGLAQDGEQISKDLAWDVGKISSDKDKISSDKDQLSRDLVGDRDPISRNLGHQPETEIIGPGHEVDKQKYKPSQGLDVTKCKKKSLVDQRQIKDENSVCRLKEFLEVDSYNSTASEDNRGVEARNSGDVSKLQEHQTSSEVVNKSHKHFNSSESSVSVKSKTKSSDAAQKKECVVKELWLEAIDDENDSSPGEDDEEENPDDSSSDQLESDGCERQSRDKKEIKIPELLTTVNPHAVISDPFFAGSDDEEEAEHDSEDFNESQHDDHMADNDLDELPATSMFYNPTSRTTNLWHSGWSQGGRGQRGSFERKGASGRGNMGSFERKRGFGRGHMGSFERKRGSGRGHPGNFERTEVSGRFSKREKTFIGEGQRSSFAEKGNHFQELSPQPNYGNKVNHKDTEKYAANDRFHDKRHAAVQTAQKTSRPIQEKLHPSWEASKKRKAEQSGLTAFQGSKIVFDDD